MRTSSQAGMIFKDMYAAFENKCFSRETSLPELKQTFSKLRSKSFREGQSDTFCYRSEQLASNLLKGEKQSLGAIFLDELMKIYLRSGNFSAAEDIAFKLLNYSAKSNDRLHVLARLSDLEKIYKTQNRRRDLFWVLNEKKQCAKDIIANYEESVANFQSIHRNPARLTDVKIQLAFVYSDLAQMLERSKPKNSMKLIKKALEIYKEIRLEDSIKYLTVKLERMEQRYGISVASL